MSIMSRNKEKVKPDCELEPINEEDDNNESSNLSAVRNDVRDYEKEIEQIQDSNSKILPKYEKRKNRKEEFQKLMSDLKDPVQD